MREWQRQRPDQIDSGQRLTPQADFNDPRHLEIKLIKARGQHRSSRTQGSHKQKPWLYSGAVQCGAAMHPGPRHHEHTK